MIMVKYSIKLSRSISLFNLQNNAWDTDLFFVCICVTQFSITITNTRETAYKEKRFHLANNSRGSSP